MAVTKGTRRGGKSSPLTLALSLEERGQKDEALDTPKQSGVITENGHPLAIEARSRAAFPGRLKEVVRVLMEWRLALARALRRPPPDRPKPSPALASLTLAALALPGMAPAAEGDEAQFQYSRYEEGSRYFYGNTWARIKPITVDSLHGRATLSLSDRLKFSFNYLHDTWGGATPVTTLPHAVDAAFSSKKTVATSGASPWIMPNDLRTNRNFVPAYIDQKHGNRLITDPRPYQVLSTASPETRKQGDFSLGYEWDEAALTAGGGVSNEPDYDSAFGSLNGRFDFNQKRTTLNLGLSYTHSSIAAKLDPLLTGHQLISASLYEQRGQVVETLGTNGNPDRSTKTLYGTRQDWSPHVSLTQVLNRESLVETGLSYTRTTGFQENPYKVFSFLFVDPASGVAADGTRSATIRNLVEQRPDVRNQWTWSARYVRHIPWLDAALHASYRFGSDDWGINAHTFEADWAQPLGSGWTVTPHVRYYSQSAADFYHTYLIVKRAVLQLPNNTDEFPSSSLLPVQAFSNDHRLSAFGSLAGGVTVTKQFARGLSLEGSFEYYTHAGHLKLGGGGEGRWADFHYYMVSGGLKLALDAPGGAGDDSHAGLHHHGHHAGALAPAGVMFAHMMPEPGDVMVGYRYMYSLDQGDMLHGSHAVPDAEVLAQGCAPATRCLWKPGQMSMHMHMLDLMYAPTDWLNLMLMPQFVDMDMNLPELPGADFTAGALENPHAGHAGAEMRHATGGIGDTAVYGLIKLYDSAHHHLHAAAGISAPTGDVGLKLRSVTPSVTPQEFVHYGMQLGSGTWDFKPSLTYTGQWDDWSWGAQLSGTHRLQNRNDSGYALGDIFQTTAWGSYGLTDWLSASVRGIYTVQGRINGRYEPPISIGTPADLPTNYGGRYWDVGFGVSGVVPTGSLAGNRLSVEWLQPVEQDVNGYQLERLGTLNATWTLPF